MSVKNPADVTITNKSAREAHSSFWRGRSGRPTAPAVGRGWRRRRRFDRTDWKYKQAVWQVLSRDAYCCQIPGCDMWGPGNVEVAHVIPVHERPDLADDPNNMITLCLMHHDLHDGRRPRRGGKRGYFHNKWQLRLPFPAALQPAAEADKRPILAEPK